MTHGDPSHGHLLHGIALRELQRVIGLEGAHLIETLYRDSAHCADQGPV